MALRTRCITAEKFPEDGVRILVMSRPSSTSRISHPEIPIDVFHEWCHVLAPPPKLAWLYYNCGLSWDEFARQFKGYLVSPRVQSVLRRLIGRARQGNVTVVCAEERAGHCHCRLIGEVCQWLDPSLEVHIE